MLHSANVLCFGIALIFYISYAGVILESLSMSSARFKPKDKKKKKKKWRRGDIKHKHTSEKDSVTLSPLSVNE